MRVLQSYQAVRRTWRYIDIWKRTVEICVNTKKSVQLLEQKIGVIYQNNNKSAHTQKPGILLRFILKKHTHTCPRRFYKNIYSDSSSTSNKQNSVPINSSPRKIQTIKSELYIYIKANTYASHKKINQDLPFNVLVEDFMAEVSQLWKT